MVDAFVHLAVLIEFYRSVVAVNSIRVVVIVAVETAEIVKCLNIVVFCTV